MGEEKPLAVREHADQPEAGTSEEHLHVAVGASSSGQAAEVCVAHGGTTTPGQ